MTSDEHKELTELMQDADGHHRVTDWEDQFLGSLRMRLNKRGTDMTLTEAQQKVVKAIRQKVYAT